MANFYAGFNTKGRVNSAVYTLRAWTVRANVADVNVTNSEGLAGNSTIGGGTPGYESHIPGNQVADVTVRKGTFDSSENPFLAPRSIAQGAFITLRLYLNTTNGVSWNFNSFLVLSVDSDADVMQEMPISFSGKSDGPFSAPIS